MYTPGKFGRGAGRGPSRLVPTPRGGAVVPRSRGTIAPARLGKKDSAAPSIPPPENVQEESFSLVPGTALPFGMIIRLAPGLVEEIKTAEADGGNARIRFGPYKNNATGNVIDVGGKEFRFIWAPEPGELCDIYEEQESGEDGNGVLVESGSVWRKLNVQLTLNESVRDRVKMRSAEAARQQKSRKAIILDHGTPVTKNQTKTVAAAAGDANARRLPLKMKKEPPPKKWKIEPSPAAVSGNLSLAANSKPTTSPAPSSAANGKSTISPVASPPEQPVALPQTSTMQASGVHPVKGHVAADEAVARRPSSKPDAWMQKDKTHNLASTPVSERVSRKTGVGSTPTDLRSLLITQLRENPKGMTIKALEKAIGVQTSVRKIETIIKTVATYQAPGRYILKSGVEKESFMKPSPGSGSSPECPLTESPLVESLTLSGKPIEPIDNQQVRLSPKRESEVNIEIDAHLRESPDATANQKETINNEVSESSSSSESGSESGSDSGSSDSESDSGSQSRSKSRSRSRSKSKSRSPAGSGSASSSESDSEGSSSSSEESDVHVDIMSDDEKSDKEADTEQKLKVKDSGSTPPHVDRDEFGEIFEQVCTVEEKDDGQLPPSIRNTEEIDFCDHIVEGAETSKNAQHYTEKIASDGDHDTDAAVDLDVIHCEGDVKSPEDKTTISPKYSKQKDNQSPIHAGGSLQSAPEEKINALTENLEEIPLKLEKAPNHISKHSCDINQSRTGSEKIRGRQNSKVRTQNKEEIDPDIKKHIDVALSQSRFESPTRPEISCNIKNFDTRQISKARCTDETLEKGFERTNLVGRSLWNEDSSRPEASAEAQTTLLKDLDGVERFNQHPDGSQSYQRTSDVNTRAKPMDVLQRSGRHVDSINKIGKQHERASRPANEIDGPAAKSSNPDEKNSRHEVALKTAADDDIVTKEKFNPSSKFIKENETAEKYTSVNDLQCRKTVEQSGKQLKDARSSGRPFLGGALKDSKRPEVDKRQMLSGKESVLKREYSDLELGEFREPVSEEEPQDTKNRFEKLASSQGMDTKVKSGAKRESASPDVTKPRGKAVSDLKKSSPSEPTEDLAKHDVRTSKRMMEDETTDVGRPYKKVMLSQARQLPYLDHTDLEPLARQEKTVEILAKAATTEMMKASPSRVPEAQVGAHGKIPTNSLQKPEYKVRQQEAAACDTKDGSMQKTKGCINSVEKCKESTRAENSIHVKKKGASSDEGPAFYAKYEKDKADLKGPIKNIQQFKEYVSEFQEKYNCYSLLNTALESDKEDFQKLERDLQSAKDKGDTKLYDLTLERVKKAYSQCAPRHKRMKKTFLILHEELKNLKQRAADYQASLRSS